ncbi:MAG: DUF4340 domain-containing protein [Lachnospiraceae bacterium]|nr:DUF4340 domain-containing protein [Lachnospiraceae bacterium]
MKKQKIQFLILIVLCLICVGGYFVLKNHDFEDEEEAVETVVTDFDKEQVVHITVSGDVNYDLVKDGEEWSETSIPDEKIDESSVNLLLSQLYNITTEETVLESPENLSEYGLEEPYRSVKLVFEDGSTMTMHFGGESTLLNKDYFQVEGDSNVYLISYYIDTYFDKVPEDFIAEEETETAEEE